MMKRTFDLTAACVITFLFSGCAGVKEAWLGVDPDLHNQLFSQRDKNDESPGLDWFGNVKRADLDAAHINAWWRDAYKLDSIDADTMCIKILHQDSGDADQSTAAAEHIASVKQSGWAAGSATTLEAEYPSGTPWPKRTPDDKVAVTTASQIIEEGKWNAGRTQKFPDKLDTWTLVCVPAPKVTAETHFITMARLNKNADARNTILVWQIAD